MGERLADLYEAACEDREDLQRKLSASESRERVMREALVDAEIALDTAAQSITDHRDPISTVFAARDRARAALRASAESPGAKRGTVHVTSTLDSSNARQGAEFAPATREMGAGRAGTGTECEQCGRLRAAAARAFAHRKKAETDGAASIAYDVMAGEYLDALLAILASPDPAPAPTEDDLILRVVTNDDPTLSCLLCGGQREHALRPLSTTFYAPCGSVTWGLHRDCYERARLWHRGEPDPAPAAAEDK